MLKKLTQKRNKKGFTLVELVVVIAILGVIAAIAVPRLSGTRNQAAIAADKATAASIAKAAELYATTENLPETGTAAIEGGADKVIGKNNLTISELSAAKLIEENLIPQQKTTDGGAKTFFLKHDGKVFCVYYGMDDTGTQLYPKYIKK